MIVAEKLINFLKKKNLNFFTGVPDSILKKFSHLLDNRKIGKHIIAVNEGSAVALGIGYHLSTKKIPCIYFQNSGLGNAINPLASISHPRVYSIPMLLIIGWRGSPKLKDEPQHKVKGSITKEILKLLNIKYCILRKYNNIKQLNKIINYSKKNSRPVACLIENGVLKAQKKLRKKQISEKSFKREFFINELLKLVRSKTKIISTTGYTSRELIQIRKKGNLKKGRDFYMVGGMGHSAMVSLAVSLNSRYQTICLDGDGSILMHLGSMRTAGFFGTKNFKHIILNNNAHESVGGQTTTAGSIDFKKLAMSLGYKKYFYVKNKSNLKKKITSFLHSNGPSLLEVLIDQGIPKNLIRPQNLIKIKKNFIN